MAIGDKLERLIDERHTNVNQLAQAVNVSPQTIYGIIKRNNTKVDLNVLQAIADELCVTLDYFADNATSKEFTFAPEEKEHIKKYRTLDEYGRDLIDTILNKELHRVNEQKEIVYNITNVNTDLVREMPLYYMPVSAGVGNYLDNTDYEMISVSDVSFASKADFAVRISGDSMEPRFSTGDIILIKEQESIEVGELGIFVLNGDSLFKQFGGNRLISLNPNYADKMITENDSFYCKGKVLGAVRNL